MRDTIALLEERVAATRVGAGGIAQMPIVGVIATAFYHYDSRAADPQLHTHVVVSDNVQGVDGRWHTLDSCRLHKAAAALSESYNAFLTDHTARLLGVRAENTAKFFYEHHHGRWNLEAGQLVLVDESSLAGALALNRITEHAASSTSGRRR